MNRRRGSLLVMTLWIVTILGALSVAVARYLSTEVRLTRYRLARHEARELARSGISLAQRLIQEDTDNPQVDWSEEPWAQRQMASPASDRQLTITITDEERKLNVNAASAQQLESLLGSRPMAEAIVAYADPDPDGPAESPVDTPPYYPKNAPVVALEELRDLPDMTDEVFTALQQFTFATPGAPTTLTVNINTALPEVLSAVGLRPGTVQTIVQYRNGTEHFVQTGQDLISFLESQGLVLDNVDERNLLASQLFTVASTSFLVISEGIVESPGVHVRIQAVIQRSTDPTSPTPKIIAWRES